MNCKLSPRDAEFLRVFREFGFTAPQLAREYGVHVYTVRNVLSGKSFRGGPPARSGKRKLTDDEARQVLAWAAEGVGDTQIKKNLGGKIGCSTIRQVIDRDSYKDVAPGLANG